MTGASSSAALSVVGLIHVLPLSGVLGSERLTALYGLSFTDPSLLILMRHRAVLFGQLGAFCLYAALFRPSLKPIAFAAGFTSVVSFLGLAVTSENGYNAGVLRIVRADVVALASLVIGGCALWMQPRPDEKREKRP